METIKAYTTKAKKLPGTKYSEVHKKAFSLYKQIKAPTKRRPYIKSSYFKKDKIFLGLFWQHLNDKLSHKDKVRRLKYYPCAIELIKNTHFHPTSKVMAKNILFQSFHLKNKGKKPSARLGLINPGRKLFSFVY